MVNLRKNTVGEDPSLPQPVLVLPVLLGDDLPVSSKLGSDLPFEVIFAGLPSCDLERATSLAFPFVGEPTRTKSSRIEEDGHRRSRTIFVNC